MSTARDIGVGVIGLGFIGQMHVRAYQAAARDGLPCRLAAVCDSDERRLVGEAMAGGNIGPPASEPLFDTREVRGYRDPLELLADPAIDLVSICTYTDTHVDLAIAALRAGKHVLVEKPIALRPADVQRLADVARPATTLCMPAMCMRFWPGWDWLHDHISAGEFGAVRAASFQRLGSAPEWGSVFYHDAARSGGALIDLHIHDADFIFWCFGRPSAVHATGISDHFTTAYHYEDGPDYVAAEAGWSLLPGSPFRMRFMVVFERAVADYEPGRDRPLLLRRDGEVQPVDIASSTGYDGEVRHLIESIASGRRQLRATLDDAIGVARMLEAEAQSLTQHDSIPLPAHG